MTTRNPTPICGAARPAPFRCAIVSCMSFSSSFSSCVLKRATATDFCESRAQQPRTQFARIRLGEVDVLQRRSRSLEIARAAAPGIVDDLMRQQQRARLQVPANGAYRRHRDDLARAGVFERPQVGAVVDLMRRDAVAVAVARQEYHVAIGDAAERERAGRLAVRRARSLAASDLEVAELGEAAAADDGQHQIQPSFMARISGRLRQYPFASMPQPNTKRSAMRRPTKSGVIGLGRASVFSTSTAQWKARAPCDLSRSRIARIVSPPSRMSSSTSTVRPSKPSRDTPRHWMPPPADALP